MTKEVESMMCGTNGLGIVRDDASFLDGTSQEAGLLSNANQGVGRKTNSMKKIMTAMGAAVLCGAVMAEVSSNVVGYYGEDATKGAKKLTMTGVAMTDVAGGAINLNKGFAVDGITGGGDSGYADNILVWNPTDAGGAGGYDTFYFYDDGSESGWTGPDEFYVDDPESSYKETFLNGLGFWFRAYDNKDKKITFSGAVDNTPYVEPALAEGKQQSMVVNPFPTTINFNDNKQFAQIGVTGGGDSGYADNILVWNPTDAGGAGGYDTFYFYDDGSESGWTAPDEYYLGDPECAYNDFFKPGKAFWFRPRDAKEKTLRFLNPISK